MTYVGNTQFVNPVYDDKPTGKATITVTPDYANGTYTVSNLWGSASFTSAANGAVAPRPDRTTMKFVTPPGAVPGHSLQFFNNLVPEQGTNSPTLQFHYLSFGEWWFYETDINTYHYAALIFGAPTSTADMPKTGTASYTLSAIGALAMSSSHIMMGVGTLSADFSSGTINTQLDLSVHAMEGKWLYGIDRITGKASFVSGSSLFQGVMTPTDTAFSGTFTGSFYGPGAAEVGYTFAIGGDAGIARPNSEQRIVGVAIGKKD